MYLISNIHLLYFKSLWDINFINIGLSAQGSLSMDKEQPLLFHPSCSSSLFYSCLVMDKGCLQTQNFNS